MTTDQPTPAFGCALCGTERRSHGQRWTPEAGLHMWTEPTREQINNRIRARLAYARAQGDQQ